MRHLQGANRNDLQATLHASRHSCRHGRSHRLAQHLDQLAGDDNNAFLAQAAQYQLSSKMAMLTEQIELVALRAVGDASLGLIGSARYAFTIDTPGNKEFVE